MNLAKHPDKTFIGRIEGGFDWLGYRISNAGLGVVTKIFENFVARCPRLYEWSLEESNNSSRIGDYARRWGIWVRAGLRMPSRSLPARHVDAVALA